MIAMTEVFIVKTFPCGINDKTVICKAGDVLDIPEDVVAGLEAEGYITIGDDIPVVEEEASTDDVDDDVDEEVDEDPELTKEQYIDKYTKAELVTLLEEEGEELNGKENKDTLAALCVVVFADDD